MSETKRRDSLPLSGESKSHAYSQNEQSVTLPHSFSADNREMIVVKGVSDVISFDDLSVVLVTTQGLLTIEGEGFHVSVLNTNDGIVKITGKLYSLLYTDEKQGADTRDRQKSTGGLIRRFFS